MRDKVSDTKVQERKWGEVMILDFDNNPNLPAEEKVKSLKESVQRALEESSSNSERLYKALLTALGAETSSLNNGIASLSERLEQEAKALADAIEDLVTRIETVEGIAEQVAPLAERMSEAESAIGNLQDYYTALEARVKALEDA